MGPESSDTRDARRRLLARVPLFSGLDPAQLDALLDGARRVRVGVKQELFHKGDAGSQLFVILSGRLKVLTTSETGYDAVLALMDPGDVFGELGLLAGGERTATVVAIDDCELLAIDRRDLLPFLRRHPEAALSLLEVLARRLRRLSELFEDTLFLNLPARLAKKLVALSHAYGRPEGESVRIELRLSQQELGDLVGTSRESVNKQLREWSQRGWLSMEHGHVTIHRQRELEDLAGLVLD